jgi:multiple sugar transport system ATP-binding protein
MFVADFIGSPPMNFLRFEGGLRSGDREIGFHDTRIAVPEIREDRGSAPLALGIRPEHIRFADAAAVRGEVFGAEYLGTTQIVTVTTANGQIKARLPSASTVRVGEQVGLALRADRLSLFDAASGQALSSALYAGGRYG